MLPSAEPSKRKYLRCTGRGWQNWEHAKDFGMGDVFLSVELYSKHGDRIQSHLFHRTYVYHPTRVTVASDSPTVGSCQPFLRLHLSHILVESIRLSTAEPNGASAGGEREMLTSFFLCNFDLLSVAYSARAFQATLLLGFPK